MWEENPKNADIRNSLAKVVRSTECRKTGVMVHDAKSFQNNETHRIGQSLSNSKCKLYAQGIYNKAVGKTQHSESGFQHGEKNSAWQMWTAVNNGASQGGAATKPGLEQKRPEK